MIPWGLGVYLQIILITLPHILDFDCKVLALSMKHITEALRPPKRPFSSRSYNRLSHADEILLDPSFLLGACTAPYLPEKQEGLLSQIQEHDLFFFSLLMHPFPISTLVIILLIQWTKVSLSSIFINQIHLRFALALTFKTQQKSFSALSEKKIYRIYLKQFHLQRGHTAILRSIVKWSPCSPMTGCSSITLINKVTGNDRIIVKNV